MDEIYRCAFVAIIAACGTSASFGLPGVGDRRRRQQPYAIIENTLFVSTLCGPELMIQNAKWTSRAWTYQEGALSTRRLVFTEEQVYFECNSVHCCEAICKPLDLLHR